MWNLVDDEDNILRGLWRRSLVTEPSKPDLGTLSPTRLHFDVYTIEKS